jgi:hypothetical protein
VSYVYSPELERLRRLTIEHVSGGFVIVCIDCGPSAVIRDGTAAALGLRERKDLPAERL